MVCVIEMIWYSRIVVLVKVRIEGRQLPLRNDKAAAKQSNTVNVDVGVSPLLRTKTAATLMVVSTLPTNR